MLPPLELAEAHAEALDNPIVASPIKYVDPREMEDWAKLACPFDTAVDNENRRHEPVARGLGEDGLWDKYEHALLGGRPYVRHRITGQQLWVEIAPVPEYA